MYENGRESLKYVREEREMTKKNDYIVSWLLF